MTTASTTLLGLALPVTGELSGTWGDVVNASLTNLLDTAIAGTTTLSSDADVTLTTTTLSANQARQAVILWTAGGTVTRTITAPAQSKPYIVINKTSSSQSIKIVGVGPTTGVTIVAGTAALVVWNGVDFVTASVTSTTGIVPVANGGTGLASGTSGGVLAYTATGTLASSAALAASALVLGGGAGAAPATTTTGTGVVTALGVNTGSAGAFVVNGGALGSPSSAGTMPAFTLSGTVAGGGNQLNNVVIGTTTPLAGAFTTLSATNRITGSLDVWAGNFAGGVGLATTSALLDAGSGTGLVGTGTALDLRCYNGPIRMFTSNGSLGLTISNAATPVVTTAGNLAVTGTLSATSSGSFTQPSSANTGLTVKSFSSAGGNQPLGVFQRSDAAISIELGYDGTTGNSHVGTTTAHDFEIWRGGSIKATATSTGLAVTGTLTSTLDATHYGVTVGRGGGAVSTNTAVGFSASYLNTTGASNTSVGYQAGYTNTVGNQNTAIGMYALYFNTGSNNNAIGYTALYTNTTGSFNVALGNGTAGSTTGALSANTTGSYNTALGNSALLSNTTANNNTAVGYQAGYTNQTGSRSVLMGSTAGYAATALDGDTHIGYSAGSSQTTGFANTFVGSRGSASNNEGAGKAVTTGTYNTFIGGSAGGVVTTGSKNTILGNYSGNAGGLDIRTASNYVVLSDGDGSIVASTKTAQTFALQGGTLSAGTGIAFPATQSASTDANTLDDYEEGTWTPIITRDGGGAVLTYTSDGTYTKVGRLVTVAGVITISVVVSQGTGNWYFDGLPFTQGATYRGCGSVGYSTVGTLTGIAGTAAVTYFYPTNAGGVFNANITAGTINFSLTYQV